MRATCDTELIKEIPSSSSRKLARSAERSSVQIHFKTKLTVTNARALRDQNTRYVENVPFPASVDRDRRAEIPEFTGR